MKIRKKSATIFSFAAILVLVGVLILTKSVQSRELQQKFDKLMEDRNYKDAVEIYKTADEDMVIGNILGFEKNITSTIEHSVDELKAAYINGNVSLEEFENAIELMSGFNGQAREVIEQVVNTVNALEGNKKVMAEAASFFEAGKFDEAFNKINAIENIEEDKGGLAAASALKEQIIKGYKDNTRDDINKLVNEGKFEDAKKLLDGVKNVLGKDISDKMAQELDAAIAKKQEDDKKQAEIETIRQREMAKYPANIAAFLKDYVPSPEKEASVSQYDSSTRFLIMLDLSTQVTDVYLGKKGDWKLIKSYICSSGSPGNETPKGTFTITDRGAWFFTPRFGDGAKYWVRFYKTYLFHSLPMDINKNITDTTLGTPRSHGCVRLNVDEAKWIYDNIPKGTKVIVY